LSWVCQFCSRGFRTLSSSSWVWTLTTTSVIFDVLALKPSLVRGQRSQTLGRRLGKMLSIQMGGSLVMNTLMCHGNPFETFLLRFGINPQSGIRTQGSTQELEMLQRTLPRTSPEG